MQPSISRYKTAISRTDLSRPIKLALKDAILRAEQTFFDYGCGLGDDQRMLSALGYRVGGWDPVHFPLGEIAPANVVNLGYVVNVIEDARERAEVVSRAWALAQDVLIVSARISEDFYFLGETTEYADGLLTSRGTFQKFFEQDELRAWIDQTLNVNSVAAAPGVFYVFRDELARTAFFASRFRRRLATPRPLRSAELFKANELLFQPLMAFVTERGRVPADDELSNLEDIKQAFGSVRRAFRIVVQATEAAQWEQIASQRALDLLIYLALSRFDGRPAFGQLPSILQRDIKGLFTTYKQACESADELLFALKEQDIIDGACQVSEVGKLLPTALYVHESGLESLSPLLRLYEGCARRYIGHVEGANLIKLHRDEPKISYLSYPDFEADAHPAIVSSVSVQLQTFRVKYKDFCSYKNPPILHRKELFIQKNHPLYEKFARLTRIEVQKGLYEHPEKIGTRDGWEGVLQGKGLCLKGHRLLQAKDSTE